MTTTAVKPTVFLVVGDEACAFNDGGEIVAAPIHDGIPAWDEGTLADGRGAGGQEGYIALKQALLAGMENAKMVGHEVVLLPE